MADENAAIRTALQGFMKRNAEEPNSGHRPPDLRLAEDERESCATCEHFEKNRCLLYDYRVTADQLCDSWTPIPEGK